VYGYIDSYNLILAAHSYPQHCSSQNSPPPFRIITISLGWREPISSNQRYSRLLHVAHIGCTGLTKFLKSENPRIQDYHTRWMRKQWMKRNYSNTTKPGLPATKNEISGPSFFNKFQDNFETLYGLKNLNTYKLITHSLAQISHDHQGSVHSLQ